MKRIGFDVDGVLADFGKAFLRAAEYVLERSFEIEYQPQTWEWREVMSPEDFGKVWKYCMSVDDWWLTLEPTTGLLELRTYFDMVQDRGRDIWFISSRGQSNGQSTVAQTEQWLKRWLNTDKPIRVLVVHHAQNKRELVEALDISYFIDDYAPTIIGMQDVCKHAFLLERAWNGSDRASYRIPSVKSVQHFLSCVENNG